MKILPIIDPILPVFAYSFDATLTHLAKTSLASSIVFPILGCILSAPLLFATRFGNDRTAEEKIFVRYGLTPLATIGIGCFLTGLIALSSLALSIILDLTHTLMFGRHALNYRYIFFPYKSNFIDRKQFI